MLRLLIALLFALSSLYAIGEYAKYKVSYSLVGELGISEAKMKLDGKGGYEMSVEAKATGIAKVISGGRVEKYESVGRIENGMLRPLKFTQQKQTYSSNETTVYTFDRKNKSIQKTKEKIEDGELTAKDSEKLGYFADDDILSLYYNIMHSQQALKEGKSYVFFAAGANKKDGRVNVFVPDGRKLIDAKSYLEASDKERVLFVAINQKIFNSENGELMLKVSENSVCTKAVLKNVIFFGDIKGILIESR